MLLHLPRVVVTVISMILPAWSNGPSGNTVTSTAGQCTAPPYATHDWIADQAVTLIPQEERAWLGPHRAAYLIGTEAPDNRNIAAACGMPHRGYDDRSQGHSVEWSADWSTMIHDRAAVRAREEYQKAVVAYQDGKPKAAAFYLGAMAHYIGDVSQYGHAVPWEPSSSHSAYERWTATRTDSVRAGNFESAIHLDQLVMRTPYTAVKRISRATGRCQGAILSPRQMEDRQDNRDAPEFLASVAASLNLGANELADVLHSFHRNIVAE